MKSFLFNVILIITQSQFSLIKIPYNLNENYISIEITIGTPGAKISSPFNTILPFTWFIPSFYSPKKSSTSTPIETNNEIVLDAIKYKMQQYEDVFTINKECKIQEFTFYIVSPNSYHNSDQGYGFVFKFENENLSIIHSLYRNQLIEKKVFSIVTYNNKVDEGTILLGGIPDDISNFYSNKGKCHINEKEFTWGCNITEIAIGNETYSLNLYTYFHSAALITINSKIVYHLIYKQFDKNICSARQFGYSMYLECPTKDTLKLKNITMRFDALSIEVPLSKLFTCYPDHCTSNFIYNLMESDELFQLGVYFIKLFNITVFDYDSKTISFYSDQLYIIETPVQFLFIIKSIIYVITFISLITSLYIIYIKIKVI